MGKGVGSAGLSQERGNPSEASMVNKGGEGATRDHGKRASCDGWIRGRWMRLCHAAKPE